MLRPLEILHMQWQPSAPIKKLKKRAEIIKNIRQFFADRDVLEIDTPLMCHTSVTDPFIESIPTIYKPSDQRDYPHFYLQTSPEYAMKRLLAAGSGSIYQICKAFRQGEVGRFHNPEFTMMEWYRLGFDHHQLMNEMDDLLQTVLQCKKAERFSYQMLFKVYLNIDPHRATVSELRKVALQNNIQLNTETEDKDTWLNLLMSHVIEPQLGLQMPCFVFDFPASQAALARIIPGEIPVAARFEVYIKGIELANGFYELQDVAEQRLRFENNLAIRKALGLAHLPIDEYFLSALSHGLPDCSGVALGVDRLIMIATESESIQEVLSFDISRA